MNINVLTLFPEMFTPLQVSLLGRGQEATGQIVRAEAAAGPLDAELQQQFHVVGLGLDLGGKTQLVQVGQGQ